MKQITLRHKGFANSLIFSLNNIFLLPLFFFKVFANWNVHQIVYKGKLFWHPTSKFKNLGGKLEHTFIKGTQFSHIE
jgi:hypothetical protein